MLIRSLLLCAILLYSFSMRGTVVLAQNNNDGTGGYIAGYLFQYDLKGSNRHSDESSPRLPSQKEMEHLKVLWAQHLTRYPLLAIYAKPKAWGLGSIVAQKWFDWLVFADLLNQPEGFSTGMPFEVRLVLNRDGSIRLPHAALYDSAGPFGSGPYDDLYIESVLPNIDKLKSTTIDKKLAIQLANDRLATLTTDPFLTKVKTFDDNHNKREGAVHFRTGEAVKLEILSNVFAWSVLVGYSVVDGTGVINSCDDRFRIWITSKDQLSELKTVPQRRNLLGP